MIRKARAPDLEYFAIAAHPGLEYKLELTAAGRNDEREASNRQNNRHSDHANDYGDNRHHAGDYSPDYSSERHIPFADTSLSGVRISYQFPRQRARSQREGNYGLNVV